MDLCAPRREPAVSEGLLADRPGVPAFVDCGDGHQLLHPHLGRRRSHVSPSGAGLIAGSSTAEFLSPLQSADGHSIAQSLGMDGESADLRTAIVCLELWSGDGLG